MGDRYYLDRSVGVVRPHGAWRNSPDAEQPVIPQPRPSSRATDMIGQPGRLRRFFQAIQRNLAPEEPFPGVYRGGPDDLNDTPPGLDRAETVTLPRHQVVMLRVGFAEMLKWAISERDCFFQCNTDSEGNVLDREDRITLDEMDAEIDRAQHALRDFDRVYPNGS